MNIKNILLTSLFAVGCISASAQQEVKKEEVFNPHVYVRAQFGLQHTLGELDWSDLNSPTAQIALGYDFSSVWGARLSVNAWQSKAGSQIPTYTTKGTTVVPTGVDKEYKWKWNYVAPTLDVTFNVTNAIFGFNPDRIVDFSVFAGVGANFAWGNDEANEIYPTVIKDLKVGNYVSKNHSVAMEKLWDGNKILFLGQFGADVDFNITRNFSLGLEFGANMLGDSYNSKKAGNCDWYFNGLAGLKYNFGKATKIRYTTLEDPCPTREVVVHDTVYVEVKVPVAEDTKETIRRDIFFVLCGTTINNFEMQKVKELADYMAKYPEAKINITGYADKGTGNARINKGYAEKRALVVANTLADKFGVSRDRMTVDSKGDTEQPYEKNDLNRVSICVAE